MKRISLKGVIVGNITDILATNIVVLPVVVYVLVTSTPVGDIVGANPHILAESGAFKMLSGILGGLCSVLGGYVAARLARHDELLNGALSSIICVGLGFYALLSGRDANGAMLHIALLPLSPALGALGGYLRVRQLTQPRPT